VLQIDNNLHDTVSTILKQIYIQHIFSFRTRHGSCSGSLITHGLQTPTGGTFHILYSS